MASSWGRRSLFAAVIVWAAFPGRLDLNQESEAHASAASSPSSDPTPPPDPTAVSQTIEQGSMVHVFDTSSMSHGDVTYYVNDHTFVQGKDGAWHLFGIFHREPFGSSSEDDFVHAIAREPDPARWEDGAFEPAMAPFTIALHANRAIGETHIWAPHIVKADDGPHGRWLMFYQGGGPDDRSSIRVAESDDLYRWSRVSSIPLFEDICVARDPMVVKNKSSLQGTWALYYTRCDSVGHRASGVAFRLSNDLAHWSEPRMVLTLDDTPGAIMTNSGFTESPFVFERNGYHYLSVSSYPLAWDATMIYRSPAPFAFPNVPFTRLRARAAEWVTSKDGRRMFMTHAGPAQGGIWMSAVDGI